MNSAVVNNWAQCWFGLPYYYDKYILKWKITGRRQRFVAKYENVRYLVTAISFDKEDVNSVVIILWYNSDTVWHYLVKLIFLSLKS